MKYEPEYFANVVLDKLIPHTLSSDLCMRHGAILAIGAVILVLHQCAYVLSTGCYQSLFQTNVCLIQNKYAYWFLIKILLLLCFMIFFAFVGRILLT